MASQSFHSDLKRPEPPLIILWIPSQNPQQHLLQEQLYFQQRGNAGANRRMIAIIFFSRSCEMAPVKRTSSTAKAPRKTTKTAKPANGEQNTINPQPANSLEDAIRVRAYELYVERGFKDGFAQEDWLRAEAELRGQERRT
jgi:hypothetical protein